MATDFVANWNRCLDFICNKIGKVRYEVWFAPAKAVEFEEDTRTLVLTVPSAYFYERYEFDFANVLWEALHREFGPNINLDYIYGVIGGDKSTEVLVGSPRESAVVTTPDTFSQRALARPEAVRSRGEEKFKSNLTPVLNFENYCVGESNRLPFTIAEFIANNPDKKDFNPFFLYGAVGIGKTHLSQAIGIRILERNPDAKVFFTSTRLFQNQYQQASIKREVPAFLNWFMQVDVLILDDLQELQGKAKTADDALFPIFNHLHQNGKQLIFTCDRPPAELENLTDRLIDRFKWGIIEELPKPDYELRKKILTFKARKNGLELPQNVIDEVAQQATMSVREIEGIIMGMVGHSIKGATEIDIKLAREVMRSSIRQVEKKIINFEMILESTADYYKIKPEVVFSKSRLRDIADARQMVMYLSHKHTNLSTSAIGFKLNRIHSTVIHGIQAVESRLQVSDEVRQAVATIEEDLFS